MKNLSEKKIQSLVYYEVYNTKNVYGNENIKNVLELLNEDFDLAEFAPTIDFCKTLIYNQNQPNKTLFLSEHALLFDFPVNKFHFGNNHSVTSYNQSMVSYSKGKIKIFGLGV